ncbi:hypothetical protein EVAR_53494_1 [Eumeta japonica]|uniref:Uncharacterized protein n=1 Tax=Eumeta variegata TaxID=151549 RepID=A0A4C1Y5Q5_EUMVA|nr:hypothetical protein EVAR_53494_1 [Eumeta japonica]
MVYVRRAHAHLQNRTEIGVIRVGVSFQFSHIQPNALSRAGVGTRRRRGERARSKDLQKHRFLCITRSPRTRRTRSEALIVVYAQLILFLYLVILRIVLANGDVSLLVGRDHLQDEERTGWPVPEATSDGAARVRVTVKNENLPRRDVAWGVAARAPALARPPLRRVPLTAAFMCTQRRQASVHKNLNTLHTNKMTTYNSIQDNVLTVFIPRRWAIKPPTRAQSVRLKSSYKISQFISPPAETDRLRHRAADRSPACTLGIAR